MNDSSLNNAMLKINFIDKDFAVSDFNNQMWRNASSVAINKYWSGKEAAPDRHAAARLLWSKSHLYVRFDAVQKEPLVVSDKPDLTKKTEGLWNRDVCELFLAPNKDQRNKYFEFEIAPTGEWIDLAIHQKEGERETDLSYNSGMESSVSIEDGKVLMAIRIGWDAFGKVPRAGDTWLGNLYRIVGKDETRGYLAWNPTETETPNFHAPYKFEEFEFVS